MPSPLKGLFSYMDLHPGFTMIDQMSDITRAALACCSVLTQHTPSTLKSSTLLLGCQLLKPSEGLARKYWSDATS